MILVDSDILIDILRGHQPAATALDQLSKSTQLATSIVSIMELIAVHRRRPILNAKFTTVVALPAPI